jgi:quinol monooxygenase YgiN
MSSRITTVVLLDVLPGRRSEVEEKISRFCHEVAARDPGTETYLLVRAGDGGDTLALFEEFRDSDAVAGHVKDSTALTAELAPLLAKVSVLSGQVVASKADPRGAASA